jgi:hypothetical protein
MVLTSADEYRYTHFELRHLLADLRFDPDGPGPGERLPALQLPLLEGGDLDLRSLDRPHLFVFGSSTCPMTASAAEPLERLHRAFGDRVTFVLVQVREAHPGELVEQPATMAEKRERAHRLRQTLGVSMAIAIDDLDGELHTGTDTKPNAAYLVDRDGTILFRSLWAGDERGLRRAIEAVAEGRRLARSESTRMVRPLLGALGYVDGVVGAAGRRAVRDLVRSAPPMFVGGRLASWFRSLHPSRRGPAVMAVTGLAIAAAAAATVRLW